MPTDLEALMMKIEQDFVMEHSANWARLKSEVQKLQAELSAIDSALARREVLDRIPLRIDKIHALCGEVGWLTALVRDHGGNPDH